jgi:cbb3-type cytochrome oxidase maturation protein
MLYILILLALMVLGLAIWALLWGIRSRQFDNLDAQAWSVVLDDDRAPPPDADEPACKKATGHADPGSGSGGRS